MSAAIYDRPGTLAAVQTDDYARVLFTWAGDTWTDLRSFYGLSDDEFETFAARAGEYARMDGPKQRPTCHLCGVELVARQTLTPEAAWCGMWWDHPLPEAGRPLIGHTVSNVRPAPSKDAAWAAQTHYSYVGDGRP